MEATGFGVMHVDEQRPHHRLRRKAEGPAGDAGQARTARSPAWASTCSRRNFLFEQLRARRGRPQLAATTSARTSFPTLVKDGKARGASLRPLLRALDAPRRRLLARRRHGRRLLGGQHRPDRRGAGARPVRPRLADLDLCRDHAAGEVRARRGRPARHGGLVAGLRRLHRLRRHACSARCCSPACTCIPTRAIENAVILPDVDIGRGARLRNVIVDRGVRIPPGLVVGEDPELDASRFRRTDERRLPDHPADDRPAGAR